MHEKLKEQVFGWVMDEPFHDGKVPMEIIDISECEWNAWKDFGNVLENKFLGLSFPQSYSGSWGCDS